MPLGFDRQSNRSQQALDDSHAQRTSQAISASRSQPPPQTVSIVTSGEDQPIYDSRTIQPQVYPPAFNNEGGQYIPTRNSQGSDGRNYPGPEESPSRSQSQRYSAFYHQPASPVTGINRAGTADDQSSGIVHKSYTISGATTRPQEQQSQPIQGEQKKSKTRGVFGIFSSKASRIAEPQSTPNQSDYNNLSAISRKASKSQKTGQSPYRIGNISGPLGRPQLQSQQYQQQQQQQGALQSEHSSESHLPSPKEQDDEEDHAPFSEEPGSDFGQTIQHDQYQQPTIRLAGVDQEASLHAVDDSPIIQQYMHQQQNLSQQQQRLAQHQVQFEKQQHHPTQQGTVATDIVQPNDYQISLLQQPGQYQPLLGSANSVYTNINYRTHQSLEAISQLSHDSPTDSTEDPRPPSSATQAYPPAGVLSSAQLDNLTYSTSVQVPRPSNQQLTMPLPSTSNLQNRKATDAKQGLGGGEIRGAPPAYNQQFSGSSPSQNSGRGNTAPSAPQNAQQTPGAGFRESAMQRERSDYGQSTGGEQGRSTPPLPSGGEMSEFDKLVIKYKKVKGLYFEKQGQVEQLQNTLANQRLSQSRTSLDDNEYATRFSRLDGAIKEIAFSIRKDWKTIPRWLAPYVNQDAQKIGTKEMTAVGRAFISRWIYDEVFNKCFHPGLEANLSTELKAIEHNIRHFSSAPVNQEEADALTSKVIQWKLATVDGLVSQLDGPGSLEAREDFTRMAVAKLTAHLVNHLQEPAPQGITGSATSIIELAVGIAAHLPRESRDISIIYPLPGELIQPTCMKIEPALPALETPCLDETEASSSSTGAEAKEGLDSDKSDINRQKKAEKGKGSLMAVLGAPGSRDGRKMSVSSQGGVESSGEWEKKDGCTKLRYAGFVGVEVRGRQWLVNAPVWTIS